VRRGAFTVRCIVRGAGARGCAVQVLSGRRVIGAGSARSTGGTVAVPVRLTSAGRRLLARARRGLAVRIVATGLYAGARLRATGRTLLIR
jgi:hypothetical protein